MSGPESKSALRRSLLRARSAMPAERLAAAGPVLAQRALSLPDLARARTVAGYVSVGAEPGTGALLDALRARGARVLLPVLLPDDDLDWAEYEGPERLRPAGRGLREPAGRPLGPEAVLTAEAVLLPGLAVDPTGLRLGRGGGSYDRVLARLAREGARPALVVLLHSGEMLPRVPAESHDRRVDAAVTPEGVTRFAATAPPTPGRATTPEG